MNISIVIPVFNNWHLTKTLLKDLSKLPKECEVIIIDDGSQDRTTGLEHFLDMDQVTNEFHERNFPQNVKVIKNPKNMGFAYSVNKGYEAATKDTILFLNNDVRVADQFETWPQLVIDAVKDGSLASPTVGFLNKDLQYKNERNKLPENTKQFYYLSGWCLAAKRKVWEKLIYVDKNCFPFWLDVRTFFEDTDLSFRARELKIPFKVLQLPLKHIGHATAKKLDIQKMYNGARSVFLTRWTKERCENLIK